MKKTIILLVTGLLLASCATDGTIRSRPPKQTYESTLNVKNAVACLIPSLTKSVSASTPLGNKIRYVGQVIVPDKEYDIVDSSGMTTSGYYSFTINVKEGPTGSTIRMYQGQYIFSSIVNGAKKGIEACLK